MAHPPERRRGGDPGILYTGCGCCSCSCCCCLHSVGGLVGAGAATFRWKPPAGLYWMILFFLTDLAAVLGAAIYRKDLLDAGLGALLFFFPSIQLAAVLVLGLVLCGAGRARLPDWNHQAALTRRIALWSLAGAGFGGTVQGSLNEFLWREGGTLSGFFYPIAAIWLTLLAFAMGLVALGVVPAPPGKKGDSVRAIWRLAFWSMAGAGAVWAVAFPFLFDL